MIRRIGNVEVRIRRSSAGTTNWRITLHQDGRSWGPYYIRDLDDLQWTVAQFRPTIIPPPPPPTADSWAWWWVVGCILVTLGVLLASGCADHGLESMGAVPDLTAPSTELDTGGGVDVVPPPSDLLLDPDLPDHLADAMLAATALWEEAVGRRLFARTLIADDPGSGCGWVHVEMVDLPGMEVGHTLHAPGCRGRIDLESRADVNVASHELGHVLGVPHSADPHSTMFPYLRSEQHITTSDISAAQLGLATCEAGIRPCGI